MHIKEMLSKETKDLSFVVTLVFLSKVTEITTLVFLSVSNIAYRESVK